VSVASTYAEALYEGALDQAAVADVSADLDSLLTAIRETPELWQVLTNPEIDGAQRKTAAAAVLVEAHPIVRNFVQVLIDRGRIEALPEIATAYEHRVQLAEGRLAVTVTSAVPLDDSLRAALADRLRSETGLEVDMIEQVDPDIVGGLVIDAGGTVLDASVRRNLAEMRRSLVHVPIESATTS
jgi:ATP synthase F1 delta subunit